MIRGRWGTSRKEKSVRFMHNLRSCLSPEQGVLCPQPSPSFAVRFVNVAARVVDWALKSPYYVGSYLFIYLHVSRFGLAVRR